MSGICTKRSTSAFLIAALPARVRPTGSGPRDRQNTPSSAKKETMRSTSRLLNAAEIAFINSRVTIATALSFLSGSLFHPINSWCSTSKVAPTSAPCCYASSVMTKLFALIALVFVLAGCGGTTTPCSDADPVGPCATSHSQTHGGS
jgi:hypothetical protein